MFNKDKREVYSGKGITDVYIFVTYGETDFVENIEGLGISVHYSVYSHDKIGARRMVYLIISV